jgi:hypothetical protein
MIVKILEASFEIRGKRFLNHTLFLLGNSIARPLAPRIRACRKLGFGGGGDGGEDGCGAGVV